MKVKIQPKDINIQQTKISLSIFISLNNKTQSNIDWMTIAKRIKSNTIY